MKHLTANEIEMFHDAVLDKGLPGIRSGLSVESIVHRIDSTMYYEHVESSNDVAALYAEVIAKGHIFMMEINAPPLYISDCIFGY